MIEIWKLLYPVFCSSTKFSHSSVIFSSCNFHILYHLFIYDLIQLCSYWSTIKAFTNLLGLISFSPLQQYKFFTKWYILPSLSLIFFSYCCCSKWTEEHNRGSRSVELHISNMLPVCDLQEMNSQFFQMWLLEFTLQYLLNYSGII